MSGLVCLRDEDIFFIEWLFGEVFGMGDFLVFWYLGIVIY